MKKINRWLQKIPAVLSSNLSIFIYLFLFFYLVIFAFVCLIIPSLRGHAPSDMFQLILGNYTNVLSSLGASIAAGAGAAIHQHVKDINQKHDALKVKQDDLHVLISDLHQKIDELQKTLDESTSQPTK